ncbi:unnamed protein product [Ilex paraguariensis]|uniref:DUF538 domain-containing protein n=1 Tax=Ilex paraguariensis TaxID=185542 RepID=A0ABC8QY26_9AQUA
MSSPAILCLLLISLILFSTPAVGDDALTVYEALQQYGFPVGILPVGVTSYELDTSTGEFTVYFNETCTFNIDGYDLKYKTTVTGVVSTDKITNLKGVQVKVLFLWVSIVEVSRDEDELSFSVGIASANFPIDSFVESPQCGCGFDCVNGVGERKSGEFNRTRFVSSS